MSATENESNRQAWLEKTLRHLPEGLRILDAGAGELANKIFCSHLDYVSQDFCEYKGIGNNKGLQKGSWNTGEIDIVSDIVTIPEPDRSFDIILCSEVFEHLPDPLAAMEEFNRLLKKGGQLIITAPFCSLTHFAPFHFSTGFNRYYYEHHMVRTGFQIEEITTNGNYFEYMVQELQRIPFVAEKYSPSIITKFDKLAIKWILKKLVKLSKLNQGSEELLCFGYHVLASKV
ncbi:MAG: class I SAM-dependent methyltransferase [Methylococcaceae bacterium]